MEEDKSIGKDLEKTNDPNRKNSGKTIKEFVMGLTEVNDLIKAVPSLANYDFISVAIKSLKENGFEGELTPDTLLSLEEIETIRSEGLSGIIKDISEQVSADIDGLVVTDGKVNMTMSKEEQIRMGVEGSDVSDRFAEKYKLEDPLNILGQDDDFFEKAFKEYTELQDKDLYESWIDEDSLGTAFQTLSRERRIALEERTSKRVDPLLTEQINLDGLFIKSSEEEQLKMVQEMSEKFHSEKDPVKKFRLADAITQSINHELAEAYLVHTALRDMEPSEQAKYFEEHLEMKKYDTESYRARTKLMFEASEHKDVCDLWVGFLTNNSEQTPAARKKALTIAYYHFMKTDNPEIRGMCHKIMSTIIPDAEKLFVTSRDGSVSINNEELLMHLNALGGRPIKDTAELFAKGKMMSTNKLTGFAEAFLANEDRLTAIRTDENHIEGLYARLIKENPGADRKELLYWAKRNTLANKLSYDRGDIDYDSVLRYFVRDCAKGDNSDPTATKFFKLAIESHYGIKLPDSPGEAIKAIFGKGKIISGKSLSQFLQETEISLQRDFEKVENVNYKSSGKSSGVSYVEKITTDLKNEKVEKIELGKTSRRKRTMERATTLFTLEDKRNLLESALRFNSPEERANVELMKAQFSKNPEDSSFVDNPEVQRLAADEFRNYSTIEYNNCVKEYVYAYKATTAMKVDNITNTGDLFYIALTTKDETIRRYVTDRLLEVHPEVFRVGDDGKLAFDEETQEKFVELLKKGKGKKFKDVQSFGDYVQVEQDSFNESILKKIDSELGKSKKEEYFNREVVREGKFIESIKTRVGGFENKLKLERRDEIKALNEKEELTEEEVKQLKEALRYIPKNAAILERGYLGKHSELTEGVVPFYEELTDADREKRKEFVIEATIDEAIETIKNTKNYCFNESHENTIIKAMAYLLTHKDKYPEKLQELTELAHKVDPNLVREKDGVKNIRADTLKRMYFINTNKDVGQISTLAKLFEADAQDSTEEIEIADISKERNLTYGVEIEKIRKDPSLTIEERDAKVDALVARAKRELKEERARRAEKKEESKAHQAKIQEEDKTPDDKEEPDGPEESAEVVAPPKDEEPASEVVADEKPDTEVGDDEKPTTEASVEEKPENIVPETAETAVLSDEEGTALMENGVYIKVIGDKKNTVVIVAESESVSGEELAERFGTSEMVVGTQEKAVEDRATSTDKPSSGGSGDKKEVSEEDKKKEEDEKKKEEATSEEEIEY